MTQPTQFDVFLCYNSADAISVKKIASKLRGKKIKYWLAEEQLYPGSPWLEFMERDVKCVKTVAVFIGKSGIGPWQRQELSTFLTRFVQRKLTVIPVLLKDAPRKPPLLLFLENLVWVDFQKKKPDPLEQLILGINKGIQYWYQVNKLSPTPSQTRRRFLSWLLWGGSGLGAIGLIFKQSQSISPPQSNTSPQSKNQSQQALLKSFDFKTVILDEQGKETRQKTKTAQFFTEDLGNGVTLEMVAIPRGIFERGSPDSEVSRDNSESLQHSVMIAPFYMGKFAITQAQYQSIMRENFSDFKGDKNPVENVSWEDAIDFCQKLSQNTGHLYRLPSESEWEYACRAGTTTPFYFGETITPEFVNFNGNYTYGSAPKGIYRGQTIEVGNFPPNEFGLYDMHGNVLEWCQDHWHDDFKGAPIDGQPWLDPDSAKDPLRVLRGGSWTAKPQECRSASRIRPIEMSEHYYNVGFRIVCSASRTK